MCNAFNLHSRYTHVPWGLALRLIPNARLTNSQAFALRIGQCIEAFDSCLISSAHRREHVNIMIVGKLTLVLIGLDSWSKFALNGGKEMNEC